MTQATSSNGNALLPYDMAPSLDPIPSPSLATQERFVQPRPKRSPGLVAVDCTTVFLILLLIPSLFWSPPLFCTDLALVSAIMLAIYWKMVVWVLEAMGPPDHPHIIAIIKAPERLYCPCCGTVKTDKYCSGCGVNVEKQYRKMVRQLARYVVVDTEQQRCFLESALEQRLAEIAQQQNEKITAAMKMLERNYVMHIVRQAKALRQHEQRLLEEQNGRLSKRPVATLPQGAAHVEAIVQ